MAYEPGGLPGPAVLLGLALASTFCVSLYLHTVSMLDIVFELGILRLYREFVS